MSIKRGNRILRACLDGAHFVAPHFNSRADLVADFACACEALFTRAAERGRIRKTPVQSLGHASNDRQRSALLSSQTVIT